MSHRASLSFAASIVGACMAAAAAAAPAGDACALLTAKQVGAALGVPVGAGAHVAANFKKTCTWNSTTPDGGFVTLMLQEAGGFEGGKQLGQIPSKTVSLTSISGVGDDAYYLAVGEQVGLVVKKDNVVFKVAVYARIPLKDKEAKEKSLAQQVVAGL